MILFKSSAVRTAIMDCLEGKEAGTFDLSPALREETGDRNSTNPTGKLEISIPSNQSPGTARGARTDFTLRYCPIGKEHGIVFKHRRAG